MKNIYVKCILFVAMSVFFISAGLVFAEEETPKFVLICHKGMPVTKLDKPTIENVFLGKTTKIADEGKDAVKVTLTIHKEGAVHDSFLKSCLNKTASQFDSYWKKQVFSGKGTMPKAFEKDKDVIEFVGKTEGAVGYIAVETSQNAELMTDKVKTIAIKKDN